MSKLRNRLTLVLTLAWLGVFWLNCQAPLLLADDTSQFFPETGHTVSGKFLEYWQSNGGLATYGYPITDAKDEVDPETGKTFLTQWFERNRFELHPENSGTKYEVLLGLLGKDLRREALAVDPDFARAPHLFDGAQPGDKQIYFEETGHNLRFRFLEYWQKNGGLERFGYPISEVHPEVEPETGQAFEIQWFERARFEYHPENKPPYDILLGLLGKQLKTPRAGTVEFAWKLGGSNYNPYYSLQYPGGVAVDGQGNVYVSDSNAIIKFDSQGRILFRLGSEGSEDGQFKEPFGIAIDGQGNVYVVDKFNNRVQKFDSQGHFLLKWGSKGTGNNQFDVPEGITIDGQGNTYVTDIGNNRVLKFDSQGHFLLKWGSEGPGDGQFSYPLGIAVDGHDNVYVVDSGNNRVQKFDSQGHFLLKWGRYGSQDGQFYEPIGIAVDGQGNVYVTDGIDPDKSLVQKFDSQGHFLTKWGNREIWVGISTEGITFSGLGGIALDGQGNVYVADTYNHRVLKFDQAGQILFTFGSNGSENGQFDVPTGIAVDGQGNIYVADNGNYWVQKFDNQGRFVTKWGSKGSGDGQFKEFWGLAADSQGNIYVADTYNNRVQKFDSGGHFLLKWGSEGSGDGQFAGLIGIAVDGHDNVFVTETKNNRIQKFDSEGHFLTKWVPESAGDGQFAVPVAIVVDKQGNVYVAEFGSINHIQKFDSEGHLITRWGSNGNGDGQFAGINGIAVDVQGNIYVTDAKYFLSDNGNDRVQKFDSQGHFLTKWGSRGNGDGQFDNPTGIAVDNQGNVYVAEWRYGWIQKFIQK